MSLRFDGVLRERAFKLLEVKGVVCWCPWVGGDYLGGHGDGVQGERARALEVAQRLGTVWAGA